MEKDNVYEQVGSLRTILEILASGESVKTPAEWLDWFQLTYPSRSQAAQEDSPPHA